MTKKLDELRKNEFCSRTFNFVNGFAQFENYFKKIKVYESKCISVLCKGEYFFLGSEIRKMYQCEHSF